MAMNNAEVLIKFKGDTKEADSAIDEQGKKLQDLQKTGEVALAGLTAAADAFAISILKGGINYNAEVETYLTRLETLTGSAQEAERILEQIKQDALATPFEVSSLTQAESLLLSTGLSAEQARSDVLALGDALAASGGGNEELARMAVNMQQIKNVGRASALDIKQFAYAGVDIYGLLADSMGITRAEAAELDVTYEMLSNALQKASGEGGKYYGAMEKQSLTYKGAMSNLNESIEVLKGTFARGLFNALKKVIPQLNKFFNWVNKNHKIIEAILIPLLTFVNTLTGLMVVKKIATAMKALWLVMAANPIVLIVAAIAALVAAFVYLWNNCEDFRNFWEGLWDAIMDTINNFVSFFTHIPSYISSIVDNIISFLAHIPEYIGYMIGWIVGEIIKFYTQTIPNFIENILNWFRKLPGEIWNIITQIPGKIKSALVNGVGKVVEGAKAIYNAVWDNVKELPDKLKKIGEDLIKGLWNGIKGMKDWLWKKTKSFFGGFVDGIKDVLGIHSPSVIMEKQIGVNLGLGMVKGIDDTKKILNKEIGMLSAGISSTVGTDLNVSTLGTMQGSSVMPPIVNVYVDAKTDPLGQTVSSIKTFSGGAKNDYNYGVGV